jgi:hypothetical protein
MKVELIRACTNDHGTFGVLTVDNFVQCVTIEDEWLGNSSGISCIPEGTYKVVPHNGTKYQGVWRLENVPGRSAILIHAGNTEDDTRGCILVGTRFGMLKGKHAILESGVALSMLKLRLPKEFTITIRNGYER